MDLIDKKKELLELQKRKKYMDNLPHLYGQKFYPWSRQFFESTNPMTLLLCGNQVGKTSIQLRKMIHWATATHMWAKWWPKAIKAGKTPNVFWFLITDYNTATSLFWDKLVPEFLPRNEMKNHPTFGWKAHFQNRKIHMLEFNSGVKIYFHAYSKAAANLQSSSVYAVFTDEELIESIYGELRFRTAAVDGYFNMVFTATLGQELWYKTMERIGEADEAFPKAEKIRATVFDCLTYEDGDDDTPWTREKIKELEASCSTENEIQKRVYGKFVVDEGLVLSEYSPSRHMVKPYAIPKDWYKFSGVDIGSGGKSGHKGAFIFIAVNQSYTKGVIFRGWKGNTTETTTSADILEKYRVKRAELTMDGQYYDWASKDFHTFATRAGETFLKANKDHKQGWETFNVLFKLGMLEVFDIDELQAIRYEASTLSHQKLEQKRSADDDILDACRYAITSIPWDISKAVKLYEEPVEKKIEKQKTETEIRREIVFNDNEEEAYYQEIDEEIESWADMYDC